MKEIVDLNQVREKTKKLYTNLANEKKLSITIGEESKDILFEELSNHLSGYSITPTTLESINFTKDEDSYYTETYSHESHDAKITRFAINLINEQFRTRLIEKELTEYNQAVPKEVKAGGKTITNISVADKYKAFEKNIQLTEIEKVVLENAINDLLKNEGKKIVLVDILPRVSSKNNEFQVGQINTKDLDTHTAILYKAAEKRYLLLIPIIRYTAII